LRVVAGRWGGRALRAPRGLAVRPTSDRVREAIFGILGDRVAGAKVLDLFAGTGAMAIEALSRGASEAVLVESSAQAVEVLKANLVAVGAERASCLPMDYRKALRQLAARGETFTLAFLDPPYGRGLVEGAAAELARWGVLRPGAIVVAESAARDPKEPVPEGWIPEPDRRYGDTRITMYEVSSGAEDSD
jgi:16S rRNA (guanine966-N2)-methyltransferase